MAYLEDILCGRATSMFFCEAVVSLVVYQLLFASPPFLPHLPFFLTFAALDLSLSIKYKHISFFATSFLLENQS